jgi:hypothetical protein
LLRGKDKLIVRQFSKPVTVSMINQMRTLRYVQFEFVTAVGWIMINRAQYGIYRIGNKYQAKDYFKLDLKLSSDYRKKINPQIGADTYKAAHDKMKQKAFSKSQIFL